VHAFVSAVILAQEVQEETNEPEDLYPHLNELIVGAIAFGVLFFFVWKWVLPRLNQALKAREEKIRGELEQAERARREAEAQQAASQEQLKEARGEAGRIVEEARRTAEEMRRDLLARAEEEAGGVVERAQEEIRAERDRAFQSLRDEIATLSVELAARVVGESLDTERQRRLVESYIDEVGGMRGGNGNGGKGEGG